jgi:hypothetical protein
MPRNVVIIAAVLVALSVITTSGAVAMPARSVTILPQDCRLLVGEEISLTLDGSIPASARIRWGVDGGGITSMLPGQNAVFIAPPEPAVVTISVSITPAMPGMENPVTQQCIVSSLNRAPRGLAHAIEVEVAGRSLLSHN